MRGSQAFSSCSHLDEGWGGQYWLRAQSWRSIRAALGDRPGSGPQPALHATASGHVEFDEVAPPPPVMACRPPCTLRQS
jgi:hypothetical protein